MSSQTYAVRYNFVSPSVSFCELMHLLRGDLDTCSYTNRSSTVYVTYKPPSRNSCGNVHHSSPKDKKLTDNSTGTGMLSGLHCLPIFRPSLLRYVTVAMN